MYVWWNSKFEINVLTIFYTQKLLKVSVLRVQKGLKIWFARKVIIIFRKKVLSGMFTLFVGQ